EECEMRNDESKDADWTPFLIHHSAFIISSKRTHRERDRAHVAVGLRPITHISAFARPHLRGAAFRARPATYSTSTMSRYPQRGSDDSGKAQQRCAQASEGWIMTFSYNRLVKWTLTAGAFASILAISGCSDLMSSLHLQPKTPPPPPAPAPVAVQVS